MGNNICGQEQYQHVNKLFLDIPVNQISMLHKGKSDRYGQVTVTPSDNNSYIFKLKIFKGNDIQVQVPVMTQLIHRSLHHNYYLKFLKQAIIDPLHPIFEQTLFQVQNTTDKKIYNAKLIPFKSYNSYQFKRGLQQLWMYKNIQKNQNQSRIFKNHSQFLHKLVQSYIYGLNQREQVIVFLFQQARTSLFTIGDYREQARRPWKYQAQINIMRDLLAACHMLDQCDLVHRDIRPSNIFYLPYQRRYVLGNFHFGKKVNTDLTHTVYGFQKQSSGQLQRLIRNKHNVGEYYLKDSQYKSILSLIQFFDYNRYNMGEMQKRVQLQELRNLLIKKQSLRNCLNKASQMMPDINYSQIMNDQQQIAKVCQQMVSSQYKQKIQQFTLRAYQLLGYHKQFSQLSHKIIQKHHRQETPFLNAPILRQLGYFYQGIKVNGTEYLLNSCLLFIQQASYCIDKQLYGKAEQYLKQAQQLYISISSKGDFLLIAKDIKRIQLLLQAKIANKSQQQLKNTIIIKLKQLIHQVAKHNIPMQKQIVFILTKGTIHRVFKQKQQALSQLNKGLTYCSNIGSFQDNYKQNILKSRFLFELGKLEFDQIQQKHKPHQKLQKQQYDQLSLMKCKKYFQQSLQLRLNIKQKYYLKPQVEIQIGAFYLMQNKYQEAQLYFEKAQLLLQQIHKKQLLSFLMLTSLYYNLGSTCYRLKKYDKSIYYYESALKNLKYIIISESDYWQKTVKGNIGLCYLSKGQKQKGSKLINQSLNFIEMTKNKNHYDYLFLKKQMDKILDNRLSV